MMSDVNAKLDELLATVDEQLAQRYLDGKRDGKKEVHDRLRSMMDDEPEPTPELTPPHQNPTGEEQVIALLNAGHGTDGVFKAEDGHKAIGYPPGTTVYGPDREERGLVDDDGFYVCFTAHPEMKGAM